MPKKYTQDEDREYTYCPALGTPYLKLDSTKDRTRYVFKARCKLWTCTYCAKVNQHQHYIRILNGCNELLNSGRSLSFVTLTSHRKVRGTENSYRLFQSAWKKLSQRARRKALSDKSVSLEYVLIPECHADGTLHWHGVFSPHFSTRWWKDNSAECGMGYQAKSVKLDTGIQATNYCLKYVTKHVGQKIDIKRFRRVMYSQKFPAKPVHSTDDKWQVVEAKTSIVELVHEAWHKLDYDAVVHGEKVLEIVDWYQIE